MPASGFVGEQTTVLAGPRFDSGTRPDLPHVEDDLGRGEVVAADDLLDALAADAAEHASDLGGPNQMVHAADLSERYSHLTRTSHVTSLAYVSTATTAQVSEHDQRIAQAVENYSDAQVEQALKCIAEGQITPAPHRNEWHVVSSDGRTVYLVAVDACGCRAGQHGRYCWHRAAVALLLAAGKAA
jgi:hypothetical protein